MHNVPSAPPVDRFAREAPAKDAVGAADEVESLIATPLAFGNVEAFLHRVSPGGVNRIQVDVPALAPSAEGVPLSCARAAAAELDCWFP